MSSYGKNKPTAITWKQKLVNVIASISVEPVMLLDGLAYSNMVVLVKTLQIDKVCNINLNYTIEVCSNVSQHEGVREAIQKEVSIFSMYDAIILSILPLFFILFMGAWSDKYGRKVPLCAAMIGHMMYSFGYLINSWVWHWPVEYLLAVAFMESLGGGAVSFLTAANSYISDVTSEENRTSRIGFANSIWFLGGPMGTLMGTYIYKAFGYQILFATSLCMHIMATVYIVICLPESHGPFADVKRLQELIGPKPTLKLSDSIVQVYGLSRRKKNPLGNTKSEVQRSLESITVKKMILDFFNPQRLIESFKCTLKKREGNIRMYILLLILANLLRKLGRGAYMILFTRTVLDWDAKDYGVWVTYKNVVSTLGSLVAVPLLTVGFKVSDSVLAMAGALSSVSDYVLYGLVTPGYVFLIWLAPVSALLVNSGTIAIRSLLSKFVSSNEIGKVSAVMGALDGVMPMISVSLYTAVYHSSVAVFPGAQFFFGAGVNTLMALIFIFILVIDRNKQYDVETATPKAPEGPVVEKNLVVREDSNWLYDEENNNKFRISTILLSSLNFGIEVPLMLRTYSNKSTRSAPALETMQSIIEEDKAHSEQSVVLDALDGQDSIENNHATRQQNGMVPTTHEVERENPTNDISEIKDSTHSETKLASNSDGRDNPAYVDDSDD